MGCVRPVVLLTAGVLVLGVLSAASTTAGGASAPPARATASQPGDVVAAPQPQRSPRAVRRYWTPERMAAATPIDLTVPGGTGTADRRTTDTTTAARARVRVPRTTGKLFFSTLTGNAVCSAAAIRTKKRNQVITAGHCVHSGPAVLPEWYSNWVFVPRYRKGRAPYGKWVSNRAWAFAGWIEKESFKFDQAIVSFKRRNGKKLVPVVGGNEVVCCKERRQRGVRIWGWPAQAPYNGETAKYCQGRTARLGNSRDAKMPNCNLTGGASGGPWLLQKDRRVNTGKIWAVTSRRLLRRPVLIAHPIPREIRRMIRSANR